MKDNPQASILFDRYLNCVIQCLVDCWDRFLLWQVLKPQQQRGTSDDFSLSTGPGQVCVCGVTRLSSLILLTLPAHIFVFDRCVAPHHLCGAHISKQVWWREDRLLETRRKDRRCETRRVVYFRHCSTLHEPITHPHLCAVSTIRSTHTKGCERVCVCVL